MVSGESYAFRSWKKWPLAENHMSFTHAHRESYGCKARWETRNSIRRRCLLRYNDVPGTLVVLLHQTPGLYERGAACFNKERDRVSTENNLSEIHVTAKRMYPATLRWVTSTVVHRSRPALEHVGLSNRNYFY